MGQINEKKVFSITRCCGHRFYFPLLCNKWRSPICKEEGRCMHDIIIHRRPMVARSLILIKKSYDLDEVMNYINILFKLLDWGRKINFSKVKKNNQIN